MTLNLKLIVHALLEEYSLPPNGTHGVGHWARVLENGLRLTEPFGAVPGLQAEASLRGLDLERLTRAFDLGSITGRLDGDVQGLQLVGWEPVSFAAELRTPRALPPRRKPRRYRVQCRALLR